MSNLYGACSEMVEMMSMDVLVWVMVSMVLSMVLTGGVCGASACCGGVWYVPPFTPLRSLHIPIDFPLHVVVDPAENLIIGLTCGACICVEVMV